MLCCSNRLCEKRSVLCFWFGIRQLECKQDNYSYCLNGNWYDCDDYSANCGSSACGIAAASYGGESSPFGEYNTGCCSKKGNPECCGDDASDITGAILLAQCASAAVQQATALIRRNVQWCMWSASIRAQQTMIAAVECTATYFTQMPMGQSIAAREVHRQDDGTLITKVH